MWQFSVVESRRGFSGMTTRMWGGGVRTSSLTVNEQSTSERDAVWEQVGWRSGRGQSVVKSNKTGKASLLCPPNYSKEKLRRMRWTSCVARTARWAFSNLLVFMFGHGILYVAFDCNPTKSSDIKAKLLIRNQIFVLSSQMGWRVFQVRKTEFLFRIHSFL